MTSHRFKRCVYCGLVYTWQSSGYGCNNPINDQKYCPDCKAAIVKALSAIPRKFRGVWVEIGVMNIEKEKFVQLIKKAITIDDTITQTIADELKVNISTLERWSNGESIPPVEMRVTILQRVIGVMLNALGTIATKLETE